MIGAERMGRGHTRMEMVREVRGDEGRLCRHSENFGFYSEEWHELIRMLDTTRLKRTVIHFPEGYAHRKQLFLGKLTRL